MEGTICELYNAGYFTANKDFVSIVKNTDLFWRGFKYYIYNIDINIDKIFVYFIVVNVGPLLLCDVQLNHDIEFSRFNEWLNEQDQLSIDMVCPLMPKWTKKRAIK